MAESHASKRFARRRRCFRPSLLLILFVLASLSCEGRSCSQATQPPTFAADPTSTDELRYIPAGARAVAQSKDAAGIMGVVASVASKLPAETRIVAAREHWSQMLGFDPLEADSWTVWGVDPARPAVAFFTQGHWILRFATTSDNALEAWLEEKVEAEALDISRTSTAGFSIHRIASAQDPRDVLAYVLAGRGDLLVIPVGRLYPAFDRRSPPPPPSAQAVEVWLKQWVDPATRSWSSQKYARQLRENIGHEQDVFVVLEPGAWLEEREATGQARTLLHRMARQMGPVGLGIRHDTRRGRIAIEVEAHSDRREPAFVDQLDGARDDLPMVGGLVNPGVLGVVRLSVDPQKFFQLVRSTLPAEQRREIDTLLANLEKELNVDVLNDVLDNLSGHAVIAIYGFEQRAFSESDSLVWDLVTLSATREAVLLPIKDRKRMQRLFDILTQLSKGKLHPQRLSEHTQYAWIEDGSLRWAAIVSDKHVLLVDSTAALDHALVYERSARPLAAPLKKRGLDQLFETRDRSGLYVDAESLANLLAETGSPRAAQWLAPFASILITTETRGRAGVAHVELVLDE